MPGTSSSSLKRPFNHGNAEESISQRTRSSMIRPPVGSNVSKSTTTPRGEHSVTTELSGEGNSGLDKSKDVSEEIGERHVTPNKKVPPTPFVRAGSTCHFVKGQSIFVYDDVCNWWDRGTFVENGEKDSYRVERETSTEISSVPKVYVARVSAAMEEQYIRDRKQKKEARAKQQTSNDSAQASSAVTIHERDLGMIRPPVGSNVSKSTTTPRGEHSVTTELSGEGNSGLDKSKDVSEEIGERHVTPNKKVPPTPFVRAGSTCHFDKGQSIFVYDDVCNWWDRGTFVENGEKDSYRVERETSTEISSVPKVYVARVSAAMEEQYIRDRKHKKEARAKQQTSNDCAQAASDVTIHERELGYYLVMGSYVMTLHQADNTRFVMFPVAETSKANDTLVFAVCRTEEPLRELMKQICSCNIVVRSADDTVLDIRGRRQFKDDQYVYDAGSSAKQGPPSELDGILFALQSGTQRTTVLPDARIPSVDGNNIDNICSELVEKFNFNECSRHCLGQVLGGSAGGQGAAQFAEFKSVVVSIALAVQEDLFQMEDDRNSSEATKSDGTPGEDDGEMPHVNVLLRAAQVKLTELNSKIDELCEGFELKEQRLEEEYKLKYEELSERVRVLERIVNGFAIVQGAHASGVEEFVAASNDRSDSLGKVQPETEDRMEP